MTKKTYLIAAAVVLTTLLVITGCSKKAKAQESGGGSESSSGGFSYDLTEDGTGIVITKYTGKASKVTVPAKIEGYPVLEIANGVFRGEYTDIVGTTVDNARMVSKKNDKAGITSITIPKTVRKIGSGAFAYTSITKFDMPDSVTEIGEDLFDGCEKLTEIRFSDNIEVLSNGVCSRCKALKKVNLPKNLKKIGSWAFTACGELTELVIPNTLKSIEFGGGFSSCGKLPLATRAKLKELGYTGDFN
jgi:hypothetical protein